MAGKLKTLIKNQSLKVGSRLKPIDNRVKQEKVVIKIDDNGDYGTYVYIGKDVDSEENTAYGIEEMFRLYDIIEEE